ERMQQRATRPDIAAGLRRSGIETFPDLLAHEVLPAGVLSAATLEGPIHTLYHPRLSHTAGRAFFMGGVGSLPFTGYGEPARVGARHSLLRQYLAGFEGGPPEAVYIALAQEACRHRSDRCAVVLAEWGLRYPDSTQLQQAIEDARPGATYGGPIPAPLVSGLRELLAGGPAPNGEISAAEAQRATTRYRVYYDHAFDFEPARLAALWERCRDPGDGCERGRLAAQALLAGRVDGARPQPAQSLVDSSGAGSASR